MCISWTIKCLILLMHGATMRFKLHESLEVISPHPALYITMQTAVIINTCRGVREFLTEQCIRSAWSVDPYCFENVYSGEY